MVASDPAAVDVSNGAGGARAVAASAAPKPITVGFISNFVSAKEGDAGTHPLSFTLQLSAPSAIPVVAHYTTDGPMSYDNGTRNVDYVATTGSVTFAPGELTKTVNVDIIGDRDYEPNESFTIVLSAAEGAAIVQAFVEGQRSPTATGYIINDDASSVPTVAFNSAFLTVYEGDSGVQHLITQVQLSAVASAPVTVTYATATHALDAYEPYGVATGDVDYAVIAGTLVFAPGELSKNIAIDIFGDHIVEGDEIFHVDITSVTGANIATMYAEGDRSPSLQVIIHNDDAAHTNVAASGTLAIRGGMVAGQSVTAVNAIVDPDGIGLVTYRWYADGALLATGSGNTFAIDATLLDRSLRVTASYTDLYGSNELVSSAQSPTVIAANHPTEGSISVSGLAVAGNLLSVFNALRDADGAGSFAYRWQASADGLAWSDIGGATGSTLVVAPAQAGQQIRIAASYVDGHGSAESVVSAALGTAAADQLAGTPRHDTILAGGGDDTIAASGGGDSIDGGAGRDTVVYGALLADYDVVRAGAGITVTTHAGERLADTLSNVERLAFADTDIGFDSVAGQAYRIYQAAFNRAPDRAGLGYWISQMDKGASLDAVAAAFAGSIEFKQAYGIAPSNAAIVAAFYQNVLHRAGDAAGMAFWTGVLDTKGSTVGGVLAGFSESVENQVALVGVVSAGVAFTHFA